MPNIKLPPNAGQLLICDYKGFIVPEMVKKRLVIAISPRPRAGQHLVHVIPLSTTEPQRILDHHISIKLPSFITGLNNWQTDCWAKCDMINTVSYARLELIRLGKDSNGRRIYSSYAIDKETLRSIRKATAKTMGLIISS
jgi:mRNA interferase MazF